MFLTPNSELYLRSGLAKSAFKPDIYGGLPVDYYLGGIETAALLLRRQRTAVRFYMTHDAYLAFYRPREEAAAALKKQNKAAPVWLRFMRGLMSTEQYRRLNAITAGSQELSAAAAARLLAAMAATTVEIAPGVRKSLTEVDEAVKAVASGAVPPELREAVERAGGAEKYLAQLAAELTYKAQPTLASIAEELQEYAELRQEALEAASALAGGQGYTPEGLSVWHYLDDEYEFRKRVQLLRNAYRMLRLFTAAVTEVDRQHQAAERGGVSGVTLMRDVAQLCDILPSEAALGRAARAVFAAKLARRELLVYERSASLRPAIFVDKSGSMAGRLSDGVEKIAVAAGLALALYRRFGGLVYLFDTEAERVSPRDVVKTLLSIRADGGTSIDAVIQEISRLGSSYVYVIVSDGITEASDELLPRLARLADRIRLILVPPADDGYNWVELLRRRGRVYKAEDVASFMTAAKAVLA